jgi:hypothetical protein
MAAVVGFLKERKKNRQRKQQNLDCLVADVQLNKLLLQTIKTIINSGVKTQEE